MDLKELMMLQSMQGATSGKIDSVYQMFISTIFIALVQYIDKIYIFLSSRIEKMISKQIEIVETSFENEVFDLNYVHDKYVVNLVYSEPKDEKAETYRNKIYIEAIFHHLNKLYNIPETCIRKNNFIPCSTGKKLQISEEIYVLIKEVTFSVDIDLISSTKPIPDILQYIEELVIIYNKDNTNELDKYQQIFTIQTKKSLMSLDPRGDIFCKISKREELAKEPPKLLFKTSKFNSNKMFTNVFGKQCKLIADRLDFFSKNKSWYRTKGIPYHMTFMLSGKPGLGKTSSIKAAANYLKRHIFVIKCNEIKTSKQFHDLFTNESVNIVTDANGNSHKTVNIPIENRIYVLEELDILGDVLLDRDEETSSASSILEDALSLDDFLNVLDGNNEYPGRVVFITTNHVEKFDKALLRGGRIDCSVDFNHPSIEEIQEYIEFFKDIQLTYKQKNTLKDKIIRKSYADICQLLISNSDIDDVLDKL
jgi:hypothetical protein